MAHSEATSPAQRIARLIDHTALKPQTTQREIIQLCEEARAHGFAAVCVNPSYVKLAASLLQDSGVEVATVVGFPLGATTSAVKAYETAETIRDGATEIDMVLDIGALKSGNYQHVLDDIAAVVRAAHGGGAIVKVIIEAALLTDDEKATACQLSVAAGADFVKTSTGFGPGGATIDDVALMRATVGPDVGVKAAGGIRNYDDALRMVEAGANRLGASAGVAIVEQAAAASK
ncbi:MAG: deoxyribose-phosphate aldolase [Anaerolineae bacterium]|nr:deoxyribose-phosphate aldolase [Anaerolineae bacterium]